MTKNSKISHRTKNNAMTNQRNRRKSYKLSTKRIKSISKEFSKNILNTYVIPIAKSFEQRLEQIEQSL